MTKNINTLLRNMKKSRNSNKPMLVVNEKPKKKKKVVKVVKNQKVTENSACIKKQKVDKKNVTIPGHVKNKMTEMANLHVENYVPNTVPCLFTEKLGFTITDSVKSSMSSLGITTETIKSLMENETAQIHSINGDVKYENEFFKIYVNSRNKVVDVCYTKKMNSLLKSKKLLDNEGASRLLVDMVMTFGDLMCEQVAKDIFVKKALIMYIMNKNKRVKTNMGELFLSKHALERMGLRDIQLEDIQKSINTGKESVIGSRKIYIGEFCTVVTVRGLIKTVYLTLNLADVFGIHEPSHVQYKIISSIYRKEGKPVTDTDMIEKIRVGLGLVTK